VEQMSREQALYFARLPEEVLSKATVTRLVDEWVCQYVDGYWAKWNRPTGMLVSWLKNEANGGSAQTGLYSSAETAQSQSQSIVTGRSGTAVGSESEAKSSYGYEKNLNNQNPTTEGRGVGRSQFRSRNRNRNQNQTYNQSQHQNRNRKDINSSWLLSSLPIDENTDNIIEQAEIRHADADIICPPSLTHTHTQMVDSEEMQMPDDAGSEPEAEGVFTGAPAQVSKADLAHAQVGNVISASASASASASVSTSKGRIGRALDPEPEKLNESWVEIVDGFLKKHRTTFERYRPALQEASLEYDLASRVLSVRFGRMLLASKESRRKWMLDTLKREVESQFPSSTYSEVVFIEP
jgi:hypothetical protein